VPVGSGGNAARLSCPPVSRAGYNGATGGIGDVLEGDRAGGRLFLGGDDAHLETSRYAVQLHASQDRAPALVGSDHFGAQSVGERAARAIFGKMETYRGARDRAAGFVSHLHRERARGAGAGSVNGSFALNDL